MDQTFPVWMVHPAFFPGQLQSPDGSVRGQPARFPPVQVHDADQLEYYKAKGYNVGTPPAQQAQVWTPPQPALPDNWNPDYPGWYHGTLYATEAAHRAAHPEDFDEPPLTAAVVEQLAAEPNVVFVQQPDGSVVIEPPPAA